MATDNPRVVGYVSPTNFELLESFRSSHGLTRSEAIDAILKRFFETLDSPQINGSACSTRAQLRNKSALLERVKNPQSKWWELMVIAGQIGEEVVISIDDIPLDPDTDEFYNTESLQQKLIGYFERPI